MFQFSRLILLCYNFMLKLMSRSRGILLFYVQLCLKRLFLRTKLYDVDYIHELSMHGLQRAL